MSERVDLVDATGVVQAWRVDRARYNKNRDRHPGLHMQIIVATVLDPDGRILVHERAKGKSEEGLIDLLCETVQAGEEPEATVGRGMLEESGISLNETDDVRLVEAGVNEYGRYCHRYVVQLSSHREASVQNPKETAWVAFKHPADLAAMAIHVFVDGFHTDMQAALAKTEAG